MTQKDKELLLKDLCARLPYGVKVQRLYYWGGKVKENNGTLELNDLDDFINQSNYTIKKLGYEYVKPYLRPMSSMTEEEKKEVRLYFSHCIEGLKGKSNDEQFILGFCQDAVALDWLNAHHFDYRGLIPMGLAIEALEDMYN